jgi:peptidylprolyl isomerase
MKHTLPILLIAAGALAASAQTTVKPATQGSKPATSTASHATSASTVIKTPPGLPVAKGPRKTLFTLQYQDILVGTGPVAEPNKLYTVQYTGWLAADGRKFDSSYDHRMPLKDKDGKPQLDADGKPVLGPPQPITFPQGFGRLIPGFDQGFDGMRIGGKRRIFIPWQLAYGAHGRTSPDPTHTSIPPKSDLIFDVELVDVKDMPPPTPPPAPSQGAGRGAFGTRPGLVFPTNHPPVTPSTPAGAPAPAQPTAPAATPAATQPSAAPATTAAPATPATPQPK